MPGWKYHIERLPAPISENKLALLGRQGFELTGVAHTTKTTYLEAGPTRTPLTQDVFIYYFKRPE